MIIWNCKHYKDLSLDDFHDMIQLREKVFVVEQDCPYLDVDGKDKVSYHIYGKEDGKVVATSRILPQGVSYDEVSIGRVVVDPITRGKSYGREMMKETMKYIETTFGKVDVRISAQTYLKEFYGSFGFKQVGEPYLEDNIPHIQMIFNSK